MSSFTRFFLFSLLLFLSATGEVWGHQKVRLTDTKTLTLQRGKMTTGRRSSPVPQLNCVYGGTVDCSQLFLPTVQCYNRGSDGVDVQWECKADMDRNYRFGHIEVVCEGYEYPEDPFILAGSCGLEYYVDYAPDNGQTDQTGYSFKRKTDPDGIGRSWVLVLGAGILAYAFYKTCIAGGRRGVEGAGDTRTRSNDDYPDDQDHRRGRPPPPPGFRGDYGWNDSSKSTGYTSSSSSRGTGAGAGTGAGGFWTGAATGGLLGYMFGARNQNTNTGTGGGGGWFGGGGGTRHTPTGGGGGWGGPQPSTSSGFTRTTSGFGGTRRR